jgi:hypothetical protein
LFNLKDHEKEWIKLPGFGVKSVANVLNAIEESKTCDLSQFIAALGTFLASFVIMMQDILSAALLGDWATDITNFLSVNIRYGNFTDGLIRYDDIVFFLSMQVLFLFLAVRVLDRKRWN